MRFFLVTMMMATLLFGVVKRGDVYRAYKDKNYAQACVLAAKIYLSYKKDSDFLTVFADACLKAGNINRMAFPAMLLIRDSAARSNSIYFLTILYQKKLLYKALIDGFDVSGYKFPTTNYILSKIFVRYANNKYKKEGDQYIFEDDKDSDIVYKMGLKKENGIYKIVLKTYLGKKLVKVRTYW